MERSKAEIVHFATVAIINFEADILRKAEESWTPLQVMALKRLLLATITKKGLMEVTDEEIEMHYGKEK